MNFAVVNLGCKVNRVESDDASARLAARGTETAEADADLIVVNLSLIHIYPRSAFFTARP